MAAAQTTTEQIAARRLDTVDPKVDLSLMVENRRGKTLLEARQRCRDFSLLKRDSGDGKRSLSLFEIAFVLVCLDHLARFIVNADRGIV